MPIIDFKRPLVLATASKARRELVAATGVDFIPDVVDIDESVLPGEEVGDYVTRLARAKAEAVIPPSLDAVIIAVDTAIGIDDVVIGKPRDERRARGIITKLSGCWHEVVSAVAMRDILACSIELEVTRTGVRFAELTKQMIDWYIESGEWQGRAGAYAIQGKGASLVAEVRGCFTNVIGISIPMFLKMIAKI